MLTLADINCSPNYSFVANHHIPPMSYTRCSPRHEGADGKPWSEWSKFNFKPVYFFHINIKILKWNNVAHVIKKIRI